MGATARSEANHCAVLEPNQSQPYDSYSDFSTIADDVTSHVTLTQIMLLVMLTIVIRSVDCSAEVLAREVCRTSSLAIVNELSFCLFGCLFVIGSRSFVHPPNYQKY